MKLFIVVFICQVGQPICDASTARVVQALPAPEGIIICGAPATIAPIAQSAIAPNEREYLRVRCTLR